MKTRWYSQDQRKSCPQPRDHDPAALCGNIEPDVPPDRLLGPTSAVQSASAREAEANTLEFVRNDEPTIDGRFIEAGKSDYRSRFLSVKLERTYSPAIKQQELVRAGVGLHS